MHPDKLIRPWIRELKPYTSARDEFSGNKDGMTFLDANENPFETGVNRYPDPMQRSLKNVLAKQKGLEENQLILGNGSDEILDLLFRVFCEPGHDDVMILPPTYGMYKVLADINRVNCLQVPLKADFQPDLNAILDQATHRTKLVFLCSPNNPTGNLIDPGVILELLEKLKSIVVIDEAYIDFTQSESWSKKLEQYPNLVVVQTLSKAYGLAGIRLGMAMGDPVVIEAMNRIKPPYNVNQLTQDRALARLKSGIEQEVDQILEQREYLRRSLKQIDFVKDVFPSDANFVLIKVDDGRLRYGQLLGQGFVIRDRGNQHGCENTLRITVGTAQENEQLLNAMKQIA